MAAIATFALKAGVWFRRVRLLIVSPDSRGTACPLSGRNSTYRPVQILEAGSIDANLCALEIDQIRQRLDPMMIGYRIETPIFEPGCFLYRARKFGASFNKATGITRKDLIYPPKHLATLGRLNRAGQPVFYSSMHKESVFFELRDL